MLESTFASWLQRSLAALLATVVGQLSTLGGHALQLLMGVCRMLAAAISSLCFAVSIGPRTSEPSWQRVACLRHAASVAGSIANPRAAAFTAVSYWDASLWGVLAVSVLATGVSTGSEAWHVLVRYMANATMPRRTGFTDTVNDF